MSHPTGASSPITITPSRRLHFANHAAAARSSDRVPALAIYIYLYIQ